MFRRILDVIFGEAKPLSGSMTAVAALLALLALVVIDGVLNLFGRGVMDRRATRIRGVAGVAVAIVAIFWPGMTIFVAVELIGLWAVLIGVLELIFARGSGKDAKDRAVLCVEVAALSRTKPRRGLYFFGPIDRNSVQLQSAIDFHVSTDIEKLSKKVVEKTRIVVGVLSRFLVQVKPCR
jgi:hypothetical protein